MLIQVFNDGDLFEKIQKIGAFGEHSAAYVIYQILSALLCCHTSNIVNRYIKAENILVESVETSLLKEENLSYIISDSLILVVHDLLINQRN